MVDFLFEVVWFGGKCYIIVDEDWGVVVVVVGIVVFLFFEFFGGVGYFIM